MSLTLLSTFIVVPAIIVPMEGYTEIINEGSSTIIHCTATGSPLPTIVWEKVDGSDLSDRLMTDPVSNVTTTTVSLIVAGVSREDSGEYRCSVRNRVGDDSRTINLVVQCTYLHNCVKYAVR